MQTRRHSIRSVIVTLLLSIASTSVNAQSSPTSPVYRTQAGDNKVAIFEKFTTIVQHSARIKKVLDFDAEVIRIDPVQGHPDQVTVYAVATGVTTVTLEDEFGQFTTIEVLVRGDVRHLESYLRRLYPNDAVRVEEIKGAVLLDGWVTRPESINEIVMLAEQFFPNVLNHMRIGGVQQVQLKATVMEVNRSKLRQFGMNFGLIGNKFWLNSTPGPITPLTGIVPGVGTTATTFTGFANTSASFGFINNSLNFQSFIDALRTEGLLKIHATPMVVTHNGQPAQILNGGETPVLVPAGLGTTAIEFKPFGVIMDAVPHILGNGRLRLQIEPQVVERDFANSITVDGITVPAFTVRKVTTQVEMNFGETLVIGGLVSKREDGGTAKLPFLGELPWIGAAFSRKSYTEAETELIILVTPEYVAPMSPEDVPAGGPGKFTDTPTDTELIGLGLLEVPRVGPECDTTFNCMECNGNGPCRCRSHSNGFFGLGGGQRSSCGNCGGQGCTDCTPEGGQPMLITPESAPAGGTPQMPIIESEVPVYPTSAPSGKRQATGVTAPSPQQTPTPTPAASSSSAVQTSNALKSPAPRPGLISPLFR